MSEKVYQRKNGSFYVKPTEFVRSEAGQSLIERFVRARESEESTSQDTAPEDSTGDAAKTDSES